MVIRRLQAFCIIIAAVLAVYAPMGRAAGDELGDGYRDNNPFALTVQGGIKLSGIMSMLQGDGTGFGYSPGASGIVELDLFRYTSYTLELGYGQSRMPVDDGEIRVDYLKGALYASIRLAEAKSGGFHGVVPYLLAGPYLKKFLTGSYVDSAGGTEYNFEGHYRDYGWGLAAGVGMEFRVSGLSCFIELVGAKSMTGTVNPVESNVVMLPESSELELSACVGVKRVIMDGGAFPVRKSLREKIESGSGHDRKIPVAK